ncbi:hypothetical protein P3L51_00625 [Streptomyces sp. PSRA5]|uniref:hypothetical protein n=1 Tax=Streptomyces panacea TaxID=3035064 RepID=UPI00339D084B
MDERATAVADTFLEGSEPSMGRGGDAFDTEPSTIDPTAERRAADRRARQGLEQRDQGHAA